MPTADGEPVDGEPELMLGPETVALLESLQRAAPIAHVLFDAEGRYLRVNDAVLAVNGGTRQERVGHNIAEVHPELAPGVLAAIHEVVATRSVLTRQRLEGATRAAPGDRRVWLGTYYPVIGRDGTLYGVGLIFEDVTDAQRAAHHVEVVGAVTAALLPATTVEEVAHAALATVGPLLGATSARIVLGGPGSSADARAGSLEAGPETQRLAFTPLTDDLAQLAERAAAGGPLVVGAGTPGGSPGAGVGGPLAVLPLGDDAGVSAALVLALPPRTPLGGAELALLRAVADQCRVARDRARSTEEASAASGLTVRLQRATARLAEATSVEQVGTVVLEEARAGLGATGGGLGLVDPARRVHFFVAQFGWEQLEKVGVLGERSLDEPSLSASALEQGAPLFVTRPGELEAYMPAARAKAVAATGVRQAWAVFPLLGARGPLGTLALSFPTSWRFTDREQAFTASLAGQASAAIERVRRHQADHEVAAVLQRALLPERLPEVEGCTLAVRYLAGADGIQVGGDWYDAFLLEDGRLALVVGDVAGHDLTAAGTMGHLRAQLRACARHDRDPGATLAELDRLVHRLGTDPERFATLVYAVWGPGDDHLDVAVAGHLPPLLCHGGGAALAALPPGPPLGAGIGPAAFEQHRLALPPDGATLVVFTDGLVERPGRHLGDGLGLLEAAARRQPADLPDALADGLLEALRPADGWIDDVALLACHLVPTRPTR